MSDMCTRILIIWWVIFAEIEAKVYKVETDTSTKYTFYDKSSVNTSIGHWKWSEWSPCSRSCGGGITSQTRTCLNVNFVSGSYLKHKNKKMRSTKNKCEGTSKRSKICNIKECEKGTKDFRSIQCERFNQKSFADKFYIWEAYFDDKNQCALNCRPLGYKFYATLNQRVINGTPCKLHLNETGVCVDGKCELLGCDGVVNGQRVDVCGVCGGDNSTCRLISGLFTRPHLISGYNYITDIPQNACNLTISEIKKSNNLIALRYKNGTYLLNGNWLPNASGFYDAAGTTFTYFSGTDNVGDFIFAPGPILQPLELLLLYRQTNQGIKYEYSAPMPNTVKNIIPHSYDIINNYSFDFNDALELRRFEDVDKYKHNIPDSFNDSGEFQSQGLINDEESKPKLKNKRKKFIWKITDYTPCSKSCGGGTQTSIYSCVKEMNQQHVVTEKRCSGIEKPDKLILGCNNKPCPAMWMIEDWGQCSVTCGEGIETREILCKQEISSTLTVTVSEEACLTTLSPNLLRTRPCFRKPCADGSSLPIKPYWKTGTWSICSVRCGTGTKTRTVQCMAENEDECSKAERPDNETICDMGSCNAQGSYMWLTTEWSQQCSENCGTGIQSRKVICSTGAQQESLCDKNSKPEFVKNCTNIDQCAGRWFTGPWTRCSEDCDWGRQYRNAVCLSYDVNTKYYDVVENSRCKENDKPSLEQACLIKPCNFQWFATSWSACTRSCDFGIQRREVRCFNEDYEPSTNCKEDGKPATRRSCNTQKCNIYSIKKETNSSAQETLMEASNKNDRNTKNLQFAKDSQCKDELSNCHLVAQARLCNYKYYKTFCCVSCYVLYNSVTNSSSTPNNNFAT